jgi:nucleotide-binding universal stress UspA family protein
MPAAGEHSASHVYTPTGSYGRRGSHVDTRDQAAQRARSPTGFHRFLVPLDGSQVAEQVLPYLARLSHANAEVTLLRAVASASQLAASAGAAPLPGMMDLVQISDDGRREAQTYLEGVAAQLRKQGLRSRLVVALGGAAEAIARAAEETAVDVIAMTTHGRGGIERAVFGSVADAVVRGSTRPVFLVPIPKGRALIRTVRRCV